MTDINKLKIEQLREYINKVCNTFQIKNKPKSRQKDELLSALIDILNQYGYGGLWNTKYIDIYLDIFKIDDEQLSNMLLLLTHNQQLNKHVIDEKAIRLIEDAQMDYYMNPQNNNSDNDELTYPDGDYDFALSDSSDSLPIISFIDYNNKQLFDLLKLMYKNPTPIEDYGNISSEDLHGILASNIHEYLHNKGYTGDYENYDEILKFVKNSQINNNHNIILSPTKIAMQRNKGDKVGMNELANIVLDLKRDFKKVSKALTKEGADNIVAKHNAKSNNQWSVDDADVNGDNIPDIIIKNQQGNPIVVNGWTTKKSDYPLRYLYANDKDKPINENTGRPISYSSYKKGLYGANYSDDSHGIHQAGYLMGDPHDIFEDTDWNVNGYAVQRTKPRKLSAYNRFQKFILKNTGILNGVYNDVIGSLGLNLNNTTKIAILSKVSALAWEHYIMNRLAEIKNMVATGAEFKKFKNSKEGKETIDGEVNGFYLHLFHTFNDWTEEKRAALLNEFLHFIADNIHSLATHTQISNIQNHQYNYQFQPQDNFIHEQNEEQDGAWEEY